jgi:hypothetical protein
MSAPARPRLSLTGDGAARAAATLAARRPTPAPTVAPTASPAPANGINSLLTSAKALKATMVVDPAPFIGLAVPGGTDRVTLRIEVGGRVVHASLSTKAVRKAVAAIACGDVALVLSGRLAVGDVLEEAGLAAMPRTPSPKPPPPDAPA